MLQSELEARLNPTQQNTSKEKQRHRAICDRPVAYSSNPQHATLKTDTSMPQR